MLTVNQAMARRVWEILKHEGMCVGDGRDAVMWVDGEKASATVRTALNRTRIMRTLEPAEEAVFMTELTTAWEQTRRVRRSAIVTKTNDAPVQISL